MGAKTDAIIYLKSTIARYADQVDQLQQRLAEGAGTMMEQARIRVQYEQLTGLMEDAIRLLSQLGGGG